MSFTPEFLDEIRARVSLADVVGKRVKLQRRGREWIGLCPFHNEKTPSFSVVEDKDFFHCFGCGAHGDVMGFVMRTEGLSFPETIEKLAGEAGLALPVTSPEDRQRFEERGGLLKALEAACAWYEHQLRLAVGRPALDYLKGRGLTDDTITRFRLGYAPDANDALKTALLKQGFAEPELLEAGLISQPEDGRPAYDFLRGRVIFPISDARGRIIAFGGRTLGDGQPKYINSRDSELFHKRRALYGLALAREAARKTGEVIVAEGYTDVIALHQAGFAGAVAPLGTALTENQIELLWKLAPEPILCFDGDSAGRRAAARAAERVLPLLNPGYTLKFAFLPKGQDPDSYISSRGRKSMQRVLDRSLALSDWLWEVIAGGKRIATPEDASELEHQIDEQSAKISEGKSQFYFRVFLKRRLYNNIWDRRDRKEKKEVLSLRSDVEPEELLYRSQQGLLAAFINHPEAIIDFADNLAKIKFDDRVLRDIFDAIVTIVGKYSSLDSSIIVGELRNMGFKEKLRFILCDDVYEAAPYSSPTSKEDILQAAWTEAYERVHLRELQEDMARAQEAFSKEGERVEYDWFNAIRKEIAEINSQEFVDS